MIPATRLGHVTFETPDLERQVAHYTQVVGLHVATREKRRIILATHLGDEVVVLQQGLAQRCVGLSLQLGPSVDLTAATEKLGAHGIACEHRRGVTPAMAEALVFDDPSGAMVELFCRTERLSRVAPTHDGAPIKLGHIAFMVHDPNRW